MQDRSAPSEVHGSMLSIGKGVVVLVKSNKIFHIKLLMNLSICIFHATFFSIFSSKSEKLKEDDILLAKEYSDSSVVRLNFTVSSKWKAGTFQFL